jgi:hypothetical protein
VSLAWASMDLSPFKKHDPLHGSQNANVGIIGLDSAQIKVVELVVHEDVAARMPCVPKTSSGKDSNFGW